MRFFECVLKLISRACHFFELGVPLFQAFLELRPSSLGLSVRTNPFCKLLLQLLPRDFLGLQLGIELCYLLDTLLLSFGQLSFPLPVTLLHLFLQGSSLLLRARQQAFKLSCSLPEVFSFLAAGLQPRLQRHLHRLCFVLFHQRKISLFFSISLQRLSSYFPLHSLVASSLCFCDGL